MSVGMHSDLDQPAAYEAARSGVGGKIFIWLAWAAAAIFWGFVLTTSVGIMRAVENPSGPDAGAPSMLGFVIMGAIMALGLVLAWGTARWAGRDKSRDPITEAATHREYDLIEAAGGDDDAIPSKRRSL